MKLKELSKKTMYRNIIILFLIYLVVGSFALYAIRPVPCGEVCIPERPFIHPFLAKIAVIPIMILVVPTLPILIPILKLMNIEEINKIGGIIILYFSSFIIWIFYYLILNFIYKFIKNKIRK